MRKFAVVLLVIGFVPVSAFGGVISFSPDPTTVNVGAGDSPLVKLDVSIGDLSAIGDAFGAFDVVFGTDDPLTLVSFVFDSALAAQGLFPPGTTDDFLPTIYADDIKAGIFINQFPPGGPVDTSAGPVRIGSLTVDTTGLADGQYQVIVDGARDNTSAATNPGPDFLFGTATINVVPEPATLSLLGLASLALIRRRKRA